MVLQLRGLAPLRNVGSLFGALAGLLSVAACSSAPPPSARSERASEPPVAKPAAEVIATVVTPAPPSPAAEPAPVAEAKPVDTRPRIGALTHPVYIWKRPKREGLALGYVRMGTSVPMQSEKPVAAEPRKDGKQDGCKAWYSVAPRGYVCHDRATVTDLQDPYYRALASVAPATDQVFPYRYAHSNGAPMYSRVPTKAEQEKHERGMGAPGSFVQLGEWAKGHEELLTSEPIKATDPVPELFKDGKRAVGGYNRDPKRVLWRVIPNGSMVSYSKAFEANGRVWLLTPDLMLVPADRVRAMTPSKFQGAVLGNGVELPLAWNRSKAPLAKFQRGADGTFVKSEATIPAKSWVMITEEKVTNGKRTFYPLKNEPGSYVELTAEVTLSIARKDLPSGVKPGEKWVEAKILPGTMTMYEGTKPVRATLFSPGKGGVPVKGLDHTKYATTQTGFFPLEWKDRVATMSNEKGEPKVLWFSDVPHIQYLKAPMALHVAYWHEDFGNPKSAECLNVAPLDGKWLFGWSSPTLPEDWGGARGGDGNGPPTPWVITAQ
jgi:hypothetical protein